MRVWHVVAVVGALMAVGTIPSHAAGIGRVRLDWTAPGDDSLAGRAAIYDLRYSPQPITATNFGAATPVGALPPPGPAGTHETFTVTGLEASRIYYFGIRAADTEGNWSGLSNVVARLASATVGVDPAVPSALSFSPPGPNPSRAGSTFVVALPAPQAVEVRVFDTQGRTVRTLASGPRPAGAWRLFWDLRDEGGVRVPAGLYHVRARFGATAITRSIAVLR